MILSKNKIRIEQWGVRLPQGLQGRETNSRPSLSPSYGKCGMRPEVVKGGYNQTGRRNINRK